jgi:hypothetical protein
MTISATTQGLRPGVCLSTAKPANPFDGQVIYMTDVDQTAVWDGTTWTVLAPIAGGRNLIINGAMQVAQRGTSTASITADGYNTADRWKTDATTLGTWTQSVENDAPTGSEFRKSLKMLCTTADASPAAGDRIAIVQSFEGQNVQSIKKGTSSASQLLLTFWVKSNLTGTYIVELFDVDNTRQVSLSYTVLVSATWEKKTIVLPADTTGAFDNDANGSLDIRFWLGVGSTYSSGTLNTSWASNTSANRAVGQTNLAAATSNYWQVTGVQLEVGAVATPFEFEDIGVTLVKCQRYFFKIDFTTAGFINGFCDTTTSALCGFSFPQEMRSAPSLSPAPTASNYEVRRAGVAASACTALVIGTASANGTRLQATTGATLVAGQGVILSSATGSQVLYFSSEL